ncbi:MAG: type VII secretion integral membrane protein EccD [Gordonia amarae]
MSVVLPADGGLDESGGSRPRPGAPVAAVPEQIRVSLHVGDYFVDASLAAHAPLSVVMEGLVPFLADTLRAEGLHVQFQPTGIYSLAVEGGMPFARTLTLSEAGVLDGARLLMREVHSTEVFKPIIEDGSDALAEFNAVKFASFSEKSARTMALITLPAAAVLAAVLLIAAWWSTPALGWWLPPSLTLVALCVGGAVIAARRNASPLSYALGISAVPLAFAVGWVSVPAYDAVAGNWTAANVFAGAFAAGITSLLVLWLTGLGTTVHTALVSMAIAGAAASGVKTFTAFDIRQIGTVALLSGMLLVAAAPALSLSLARVRPPSLPVPGEDIDRRELDEAAMVVEVFDDGNDVRTVALSDDEDTQLERRSRVANKYLTGLFLAAVIIAVVGAVSAVEVGTHYYYGELATAVIAVLVLALRARSLIDRVHTTTFYAGAFALTAGLTFRVVTGTGSPLVGIGVIAGVVLLAVATALAAMLLPGLKISPITLRRIEQIEFLLIMAIGPLAFWTIGAFNYFRNLL